MLYINVVKVMLDKSLVPHYQASVDVAAGHWMGKSAGQAAQGAKEYLAANYPKEISVAVLH